MPHVRGKLQRLLQRHTAASLQVQRLPDGGSCILATECPSGTYKDGNDHCQDTDNVALKGVAMQSSTCLEGAAARAIDGNKIGTFIQASVSHTCDAPLPHWWQVDLRADYTVSRVTLWNRWDCCWERLNNVEIRLLNTLAAHIGGSALDTRPVALTERSPRAHAAPPVPNVRLVTHSNAFWRSGARLRHAPAPTSASWTEARTRRHVQTPHRYACIGPGLPVHRLRRGNKLHRRQRTRPVHARRCPALLQQHDERVSPATPTASPASAATGPGTSCPPRSIWLPTAAAPTSRPRTPMPYPTRDNGQGHCVSPYNVALRGVATQSSTDLGAEASRAIDGNRIGFFNENSVSHTAGAPRPHWWQVVLDRTYDIEAVTVWNRRDCCWERLQGLTVVFRGLAGNEITRSVPLDWEPDITSIDMHSPASFTWRAQPVLGVGIVEITHSNTFLALAEVEVWRVRVDCETNDFVNADGFCVPCDATCSTCSGPGQLPDLPAAVDMTAPREVRGRAGASGAGPSRQQQASRVAPSPASSSPS